jgi:hypothetical protein
MRILTLAAPAAISMVFGAAFAISAMAQTQTPACGIETWSAADQKYVSTPCTPAAPKAATGSTQQNCGIETYSAADQKYVSTPCTAETAKSDNGQASCGIETWSAADQRYVSTPCAHR